MGFSPYSRTRPPDLSSLPRCEAWTRPRLYQDKPTEQCSNAGAYERDGHRVCMVHKNMPQIAFSAEAAAQLLPRWTR